MVIIYVNLQLLTNRMNSCQQLYLRVLQKLIYHHRPFSIIKVIERLVGNISVGNLEQLNLSYNVFNYGYISNYLNCLILERITFSFMITQAQFYNYCGNYLCFMFKQPCSCLPICCIFTSCTINYSFIHICIHMF